MDAWLDFQLDAITARKRRRPMRRTLTAIVRAFRPGVAHRVSRRARRA
jgi:hypothetical protein